MSQTDTPEQGTLDIPEAEQHLAATRHDAIDDAVAAVRAQASAWVQWDVADRIALLEELRRDTLAVAEEWVTAAAAAKGIARDSQAVAEEWLGGPILVLRNLRLLAETLRDIAESGAPQPKAVSTRADGQVEVRVFPTSPLDNLLFAGFTADVRLAPDVSLEEAEARMGRIYRPGGKDGGGTRLVLGRRQRVLHRPDGRAPRAVHRRPGLRAEDEPGQRLRGALPRAGAAGADPRGPAAGGLRRRRRGRLPHRPRGHRRDPHDRLGQDLRRDRVRPRRRGSPAQGRAASRASTSRSPPSSATSRPSSSSRDRGPTRDIAYHGDNIASMLTNNAGFNCIAARASSSTAPGRGDEPSSTRSGTRCRGRVRASAPTTPAPGALGDLRRRAPRRGAVRTRTATTRSRGRSSAGLDPRGRPRARVPHRGVLWRVLRGGARRATLDPGVPRAGGRLLQRRAVGDAVGVDHRAPEVAAGPAGGGSGRARRSTTCATARSS